MGRKSIKIELIKDERKRQATLEKRRFGLFKKAHELGILCGVKISVHIFGPEDTLSRYTSGGQQDFNNCYSRINTFDINQDLTEKSMTPLLGEKNINGKRPADPRYSADSTSFEDDDHKEKIFQNQLNTFGVINEYNEIKPTDINPQFKQRKLSECHTTSSSSSSTSSFNVHKPSPIYENNEQLKELQDQYIFPSSDNNVFENIPTSDCFPFEPNKTDSLNCYIDNNKNNNHNNNNNNDNTNGNNGYNNIEDLGYRKSTYENRNSYLDGELLPIITNNSNEHNTEFHNFDRSFSPLISHHPSHQSVLYNIKPNILNIDKSTIFNPDNLLETPETEILDFPLTRK